MRRIVMLGTGTGVGKTYFSCALARALAAAPGSPCVQALKPIETGVHRVLGGEVPIDSDAALLEAASSPETRARPHPFLAFHAPVSPHLAAREANVEIDVDAVAAWADSAAQCMTSHVMSCQIIETAGGACTPLGARLTNIDLARALDPAHWILVAPDALGVLHDVRASLAAFAALARLPDYLVLSAAREPDSSTGTNAAELVQVGLPKPAAALARNGGGLESLIDALLNA